MGKSSPFGINGHYFPQAASSVSFPAFLMSTAFYFSDPGTSTFGQLEFVNQSTAPVSALVPTSFGALPGQGDLDLLPGGNYAVVTSNGDIVADLVDTAGVTFVNDVVVNSQSGTAGSQSEPAVATGAHPDQALVVAFKDSPTGAGSEDITVVTTNMGASSVASVTTVLPGVQRDPDVAALALPGGFGSAGHVVVFVDQDASADGSGSAIRARFVDAAGVAGPVATVNSTTGGDQTEPVITALADGRVFVAWTDASGTEGVGGGGTAVRGRLFDIDPAGALVPAGGDLLVNTYTAGDQSQPAIATTSDGLVAVAWTSESGVLDTDLSGISMQLFDPRLPADTKVGPSGRVCFPVAGAPGDLAVVNLTPVEADGLGNGQLVSSDVTVPPVASNVNFSPGSFDPNVAVAPIGGDGKVCFVNSVHSPVHLVADHLGTIDAASYTLASQWRAGACGRHACRSGRFDGGPVWSVVPLGGGVAG